MPKNPRRRGSLCLVSISLSVLLKWLLGRALEWVIDSR